MYIDEWYLIILAFIASFILVNGKTGVDDIEAPWTAIFFVHLQKENLYRKKWQAGEDFVLQFNIEVILGMSEDFFFF